MVGVSHRPLLPSDLKCHGRGSPAFPPTLTTHGGGFTQDKRLHVTHGSCSVQLRRGDGDSAGGQRVRVDNLQPAATHWGFSAVRGWEHEGGGGYNVATTLHANVWSQRLADRDHLLTCVKRDWYSMAEQPAPAPHLALLTKI